MSSLRCAVRGSGLLHVAFNQDNTCLVVTDMNGLSVFSIEQHKRAFRLDIGAIRYGRRRVVVVPSRCGLQASGSTEPLIEPTPASSPIWNTRMGT